VLAYILMTAKANVMRTVGNLAVANEIVNEALVRYELYASHLFVALPSIAKFLIELEQCNAAAANHTLARLRSYPIDSILAYRIIIELFSDFLIFESGGTETQRLSEASSDDVSMLCDGVWGEIWVLRWIYGIKAATRSKDWVTVGTSLAELESMLKKLKNSLWHSWLFDACAFALIAKGEWQTANSLLQYSKRLIETAGIKATPRQQRDWQRIEAATASQQLSTVSTLTSKANGPQAVVPRRPKVESIQWHGASAETLRLLKEHMTQLLFAPDSTYPSDSLDSQTIRGKLVAQ
jgi:hypothetical protein